MVLEKVQHEILENPVKDYNFEVKDFHTYFVGEEGVWVHNMCARAANSSTMAGKASREVILSTEKTHESARNTLLRELDLTGAFKNGSNKCIGRLKESYGYGKQIGRQSLDGKVRWRLDYDEILGVHYNIEDFTNGKGASAVKKVIPIDISYEQYVKIIDLWN